MTTTSTLDLAAAREVAEELTEETGTTWTAREAEHYGAYLVRTSDRLTLWLHQDHTQAQRIALSPTREEHHQNRTYSEGALPEIGCAYRTKGPNAVARDILRRLLPEAEVRLATLRDRVARQDAYYDRVRANVVRLTEAAPAGVVARLDGDGPGALDVRTGETFGRVKVLEGSVNLDLHAVPVETAAAILRLLG